MTSDALFSIAARLVTNELSLAEAELTATLDAQWAWSGDRDQQFNAAVGLTPKAWRWDTQAMGTYTRSFQKGLQTEGSCTVSARLARPKAVEIGD